MAIPFDVAPALPTTRPTPSLVSAAAASIHPLALPDPPEPTAPLSAWAALDALPHPVSVLSRLGRVVFVNTAWRQAAARLEICLPLCCDPERAAQAGHHHREAAASYVEARLSGFLAGEGDRLELLYGCLASESEGCSLVATPCVVQGARGALVQLLDLGSSRARAESAARCRPGRAGPSLARAPRNDLLAADFGRPKSARAVEAAGPIAGERRPPRGASRWEDDRREHVALASQCDTTVLLLGESGVGKTHLARDIHAASARARGPLLDINCAGLSATLLESELFGYERGAFTGAAGRKRGLLEAAEGGTVFLDEIGELDPIVQAKLLKVLETRRFRRLGGQGEIAFDARIIVATHRDLLAEVAAGRFREDLYYRIRVLEIAIPPLRDRTAEIGELAQRLLLEIARVTHRRPPRLAPESIELLEAHTWPGNLRELRNVLERAALGCSEEIPAERLASALPTAVVARPHRSSLASLEQGHIERTLAETGFNLRRAAQVLGISRSTLYERLHRYGIDLASLRRDTAARTRRHPETPCPANMSARRTPRT